MKSEVDSKIFKLQLSQPEIKLMSQHQRIIHMSDLSLIFSCDEIKDALIDSKKEHKDHFEEEEFYQPKDRIINKGEYDNAIWYVARGMIVEKNGEYMDNSVNHLRLGRGRVAGLQNLLVDNGG